MNLVEDTWKEKGCQGSIGVYSGLSGGKVYSGILRCNRWSCRFCGPRKLKKLRKRMLSGEIALQGVSRHGLKFATLTFGGTFDREPFRLYNSETGEPLTVEYLDKRGRLKTGPAYDLTKMYDVMMEAFNKLRTALVKKYGKFKYFRIHEPHLDGVPHLHVLFAGNAVIPKNFLATMQRLWTKYGLGFVKLSTIRDKKGRAAKGFQDVQHAVNYLLKYMTKGLKTAGKYKRVFSCSQKSLLPIEKKDWEIMQIIMGKVDDKGQDFIEEVLVDFKEQEIVSEKLRFLSLYEAGYIDNHAIKPDIVELMMTRHIKELTTKEIR